jgi:hypothetical protein
VAARYFTPEEANEALVRVRPLAEEMVQARQELGRAHEHRAELERKIAGNGGGIEPSRLVGANEAVERAAESVLRCVEGIRELGAIVKDVEAGLLDFPALRAGEEVLLCWRVGEDAIAWWHGLEDGFAGRRPLPL